MQSFVTDFHGYSVEFSPFEDNKLAVATAQHYGIVGNGKLFVLDLAEGEEILLLRSFDTKDGLFDCAWSEENENHLVTCSGDGSLRLWDLGVAMNPLQAWQEHTHEVYGVDWSLLGKDRFVSSSWDKSVKLWDPLSERSLRTWQEHEYCVYSAVWSPSMPNTFASVSGDFTMKIWDTNQARSTHTVHAHDFEVLCCDWNKYNDFELATGSVDKTIRIWDLRKLDAPVARLSGHSYAIRRLKYSPHCPNVLASSSYDMTVMLWDLLREDPLLDTLDHHTEFVIGIDFSLFNDRMASCSWDGTVAVWPGPPIDAL